MSPRRSVVPASSFFRAFVSCHRHQHGQQALRQWALYFVLGSDRVPRMVRTEWIVCVERPVFLAIACVPRPCS